MTREKLPGLKSKKKKKKKKREKKKKKRKVSNVTEKLVEHGIHFRHAPHK